MRIINFFICLFFLGLVSPLSCQFSKGMLKMEVSKIKLNGEDAPPQMAAHLGNMNLVIYSNGMVQKSVMDMMMMKTTTIVDSKSDSISIYMDIMGKKYKITESRKSFMDSTDKAMKNLNTNAEIKEFPNDTKEILGYKCHKITVKMNVPKPNATEQSSQEMNITMYVTKQLKFDPSFVTQTGKNININGTPLEYNMSMGEGSFQMNLTMMAKEYQKEVNETDMLAPQGNFKSYTMEQFQKEMSSMGGSR